MHTEIGTDIARAATLLQQDELVAIPTETVYGLAANALSESAVLKIFEAKQRPRFNPLIVHIKSWTEVNRYAKNIPQIAHQLAAKYCPGPLSFLLEKQDIVPDLVTAGSPLVAIRVPRHPLSHQLLETIDFPLAAPSANEFGYISPTLAGHVYDSLQGRIPYILDGGPANVGLESTIIGFEGEQIIVHRAGGLSLDQLQSLSMLPLIEAQKEAREQPLSSGQLKSHYAPHTALYIGDIRELAATHQGKKAASIQFSEYYDLDKGVDQYILSPKAELNEAATQLFKVMREIDQKGYELIFAEIFPDKGLGKAINDRLNRAQAVFKNA